MSIALADVQSVTAKQTDAPRTVLLVVVVGGLFVAGIVYLVQCSGDEGMAAVGCP